MTGPDNPYDSWDSLDRGPTGPVRGDVPGLPTPPPDPAVGRHLASVPPAGEPAVAAVDAVAAAAAVDWAVALRLQGQVARELSNRLAQASRDGRPLDRGSQEQLGRTLIVSAVGEHIELLARHGGLLPGPDEEDRLVGAVFDAQFRLGRLQPLIDHPAAENIEIMGTGPVRLELPDGSFQWAPPVADSEDELVAMIRAFAASQGGTARDFSTAHPLLRLSLSDMTRVSASMEVSGRVTVSIRKHRLVDVDLDDLERVGSLDHAQAEFLRAAVRARKNIVVAGDFNTGKTTFVRALANEVDPDEKIVTIEQERELGLHLLTDRHHVVQDLEARDASAEGQGLTTLTDLVLFSMGVNARRVILGEVRGEELGPMLTAMTAGDAGSLCTVHSHDAYAVFSRFMFCGSLARPPLSREAVNLALGDAVHFIVHLRRGTAADGTRSRYLGQVLEIAGSGETGRPATNEIFAPGPDGRARLTGTPVACLDELVAAGLDPRLVDGDGGPQ